MKRLLSILFFAALTVSALVVPAEAPAKSRKCSGVVAGKFPVVVIRGVTCSKVKRVAARFLRSDIPDPGTAAWSSRRSPGSPA